MPTDLTGQTFGSFKLISVLGRGGMATVYRGYQESIDRTVAVKVLPAEFLHDPNFSQRFLAEAKTLAKLTHPAILPLYDFGYANNVPYIVMPLMTNGTLTDKLKHDPLSISEAIRIFTPIADALDFAHKNGVLHRDVKPSNILFDQNDNPFLADFGIAKAMESASNLTGTGIVGTPDYMSPEQARGEQLDGRSDLYSLGVMVYQSLTGNPLFRATTPIGVMLKHATEPPPPIREQRPDLSSEVESALDKALAKDPNDRYQTGNEFMRTLREVQAGAATQPNAQEVTMVEQRRTSKQKVTPPTAWNQPQRTAPPPAAAYTSPQEKPAPVKQKDSVMSWLLSGSIGAIIVLIIGTLVVCGGCFGLYLIGSAVEGTPTPKPSLKATLTPTPSLVTLFSDDFANSSSGWNTLNSESAKVNYTSGEYVVKFNKNKWYVWSNPGARTFKNVQVEVTVKNTSAVADASFGVICNYVDKDNYYYTGIDANGFYAIVKYKGQKDNFLTGGGKWAKSSKIALKANEYNIIAECINGSISLYVDGALIETVKDSDYSSGNVGLFAWSNDTATAEIHFDDFYVSQTP